MCILWITFPLLPAFLLVDDECKWLAVKISDEIHITPLSTKRQTHCSTQEAAPLALYEANAFSLELTSCRKCGGNCSNAFSLLHVLLLIVVHGFRGIERQKQLEIDSKYILIIIVSTT